MEVVYAALLLHKSGSKISEDNLKTVLQSAGAHVEDSKIKALVASLNGINIDEAIKEAATVTVAPITQHVPAEKKEEKKEEKKDDVQAAAGLSSLFG